MQKQVPFSVFGNAIAEHLAEISLAAEKRSSDIVFLRASVTAEQMWNQYLSSYTPEENPIYRTKTEHDCSCCRHFIRDVGALVYIRNGQLKSIWDVQINNETFQRVANNMRDLVLQSDIKEPFMHYERNVGAKITREMLNNGSIHTWEHFYGSLPSVVVKNKSSIPTMIGDLRETYGVFKRSLTEITGSAIDTVLELINQNSIYRGKEFKDAVLSLAKHKAAYEACETSRTADMFLWQTVLTTTFNLRIRNTVIGTLLVDISEGMDLTKAVASYESKVAPANYRRPTALVTKSMIANAQKFVEENGLESALYRRHATLDDITVNNVLFADRSVLQQKGVFGELLESTSDKLPALDKIESISMEDFIQKVLPTAKGIDIYFDSRNGNNLFSLIAPLYSDAKSILRWNNNFSWTYNGDVTDSIKERVKAAGGEVSGQFRISLSWNNLDDLDLSVVEPKGTIYFGNRKGVSGGILDVDANSPASKHTRTPVENIYWKSIAGMVEGNYKVIVNQYCKRENKDFGFTLEVELDGRIMQYHHQAAYNSREVFLEFNYNKRSGITFNENYLKKFNQGSGFGGTVVEKWNILSGKFHKVNAMMLSPNFWDDNSIGNKHYMFVIDGCKNPEPCRGLYNEFLSGTNEHRKVFEMLGSKLMVQPSEKQLSGLGFSDTKKDVIIVRVNGNFSRILKINVG